MTTKTALPFIAMIVMLFASGSVFAEDERLLIKTDTTTKSQLLKEMRDLTERLDEVLAALAEGDFKTVARLAEINLGFGHKKLEAMVANGASEEEVQAKRARIKTMRAAREKSGSSAHGKGGDMFGLKPGIGQKLPEDFWLMGQAMHGAAEGMGEAARKAAKNPTAADYKSVLAKLQEMTTTCIGCHSAFRVH